ncbi:MAG TPA: N-6 DNA methylase [Candidatus Ratteibacteria bacterium]|nr:N-6 DNA methylase [Candidatus Ratteibacteria bacterium]
MARKSHLVKPLELFTPTLLPLNLPEVFKQIYYYLYSNSNIPRAERLGAEMIRILFCKIYDETHNNIGKEFAVRSNESEQGVGERIKNLFEMVKDTYPDVFDKEEKIYLDHKSIKYVVEKLQDYDLIATERDVISEAFQAFWGPGLRGEKGQFFTPRNIVKMCVDMLNPKNGERVIDPACGSGGFLVEVLSLLENRKCFYNVYGIDKEVDLVKICKAYMAIVGDGHTNIFCADSLHPESWPKEMKEKIEEKSFDVVLTNPPFGAKIFIEDKNILKNFKLGHEWIKDHSNNWRITNSTSKQVPQILFIERCLQLLKPGGRIAIVLPDGVFGNPSDRYVWHFILENTKILAIVSLPPETFLPSTHTKTSVLFLEKTKNKEKDYEIFMAIANRVGHDKNGKIIYKMDTRGNYILDGKGNKIIDDDLPLVSSKYKEFQQGALKPSHFGFIVRSSEIINYVFIPSYYDPETMQKLNEMGKTEKYKITTIKEMVEHKLISIKRGHEVGSRYYGMGDVPFVRTSDIVNWEIKIDPVKSIPEEVYEQYKKRQDIRENDILLVTDGTFLIGRTAIITPIDKKIVIQSHIRRIRCLSPEKLHPYLLLYLLNTEIVQKQIEEKTFVQATISTIGERLYEIVIPVPTNNNDITKIIDEVSKIIKMKVEARTKMENLIKK